MFRHHQPSLEGQVTPVEKLDVNTPAPSHFAESAEHLPQKVLCSLDEKMEK
jgi:hypothetical protein